MSEKFYLVHDVCRRLNDVKGFEAGYDSKLAGKGFFNLEYEGNKYVVSVLTEQEMEERRARGYRNAPVPEKTDNTSKVGSVEEKPEETKTYDNKEEPEKSEKSEKETEFDQFVKMFNLMKEFGHCPSGIVCGTSIDDFNKYVKFFSDGNNGIGFGFGFGGFF